jgi:hypothetical protein
MARAAVRREPLPFDRIAATCAALVIVGLVVFLLVRNEEIAGSRLFFALRVVLSLSAAVFGATIPGFLQLGWSGRGAVIRAGGALALFVLTFLYTPDLVNEQKQQGEGGTTNNAPGGVIGRSIDRSNITINNAAPPAPPSAK